MRQVNNKIYSGCTCNSTRLPGDFFYLSRPQEHDCRYLDGDIFNMLLDMTPKIYLALHWNFTRGPGNERSAKCG